MPLRQVVYSASEKPRWRVGDGRGAHGAALPGRAPVRRMKAELTSCAPASARTCAHLAAGQHAALVQDHEIVARHDLVEQMRGPQHADALLGHELPDMAEDVGARLDVEPDGRPRRAAAAAADAAARARSRAAASGRRRDRAPCCRRDRRGRSAPAPRSRALPRLAAADAVQRGVIEQVLHHARDRDRACAAGTRRRAAAAPRPARGRCHGRKCRCGRSGCRTAA